MQLGERKGALPDRACFVKSRSRDPGGPGNLGVMVRFESLERAGAGKVGHVLAWKVLWTSFGATGDTIG